MSKSKNRAYNRYEPENRKADSKRYKMDRRERAKLSHRFDPDFLVTALDINLGSR